MSEKNKLYVGNINYDTTEESLREAFGADGRNVLHVKVIVDRDTGRKRGFAFVEMASESDAQAAIDALNGQELDGRTITVNEARERERKDGFSGGGHRGGGGFGGGFGGNGGNGAGGGGRGRHRPRRFGQRDDES